PKCGDACPVKALPFGPPKVGGGTSSIQAVKNGLPTPRTVFRSGPSSAATALFACEYVRLIAFSAAGRIGFGSDWRSHRPSDWLVS
ncbi:MAG: hypothetical protein RMX60_10605, partial [Planktomarina sp.]|nr:hypothetical protein [Planktomarina sp.]